MMAMNETRSTFSRKRERRSLSLQHFWPTRRCKQTTVADLDQLIIKPTENLYRHIASRSRAKYHFAINNIKDDTITLQSKTEHTIASK